MRLKNILLQYRFKSLILAAIIGIALFYLKLKVDWSFLNIPVNQALSNSISLICLTLPVITLLWFFRTSDVREQIEKTQDNLNITIINNATKIIIDNLENDNNREKNIVTSYSKKYTNREKAIEIAIRQLMYARNELNVSDQLKDIIDNATRGLDLSNTNLNNINFSGADLSDAILIYADLFNANLEKTNLKNAIYSENTIIEDKFKDQMVYESYYEKADF